MPNDPREPISREDVATLSDSGESRLADKTAELREERRAALTDLADLYERREQFRNAGLDETDAPVAELQDHIDELEDQLGVAEEPAAEEVLAAEYDVDEDAVAALDDEATEELLAHLQAVDDLEASNRDGTLVMTSLQERREQIAALAHGAGTQPAALMPHEDVEHEARLGASEEVDTSGTSQRVAVARLEDAIDDVDEAIRETDSKFTEAHLREQRDDLERRLDRRQGA